MKYLTFDPGVNGGAAHNMGKLATAWGMPATEGDLFTEILEVVKQDERGELKAVVEDIPKYVGIKIPGSSVFPLAFNAGLIRGSLTALRVPIILVKPQDWQKHFRLGTKRDAGSTTVWKNRLKAEAQRRFPHLTVSLKTADALLILAFAQDQKL